MRLRSYCIYEGQNEIMPCLASLDKIDLILLEIKD